MYIYNTDRFGVATNRQVKAFITSVLLPLNASFKTQIKCKKFTKTL